MRQVRLLGIGAGSCGQPPGGCQTEREDVYFTVPPKSRVYAYARDTSGPLQPCLASAVVDKDTTIDVKVAPAGSSLTPPPGVNAPVWMGVSSYQEWIQTIPGTADLFFEIELRR